MEIRYSTDAEAFYVTIGEEERASLVGRFPVAAEALTAIERLTRMST